MRRAVIGAFYAAAVMGAAGAAQAQDRPRYIPTRDVAVNYSVTSDQPGVPPTVLVRISAAGLMRIDAGERGYLLFNSATSQTRWVLPQAGMFIDLPTRGSLIANFLPEADAHFARRGAATVAGLACTQWHVSVPRGNGDACVTQDGVILRGTGADSRGHSGAIEATNVTYAPQPPATFEPPPGFQHMSLPKGLNMSPPGGL